MECLPEEHSACVLRHSEKDSRPGAKLFRGLAGVVYRDGDQTHQEETGEEITRKITLGPLANAKELLTRTKGCQEFTTSLIERFNGTMRERLASLTRKCRHAAHRLETLEAGMYLIGETYNFCWPHHELSTAKYYGRPCTPAMAAGLTDHIWSVLELLRYKIAPAPWIAPKRTRRGGKGAVSDLSIPKRPRGRPRIHPLPDPTLPKRPRGRPRKIA